MLHPLEKDDKTWESINEQSKASLEFIFMPCLLRNLYKQEKFALLTS
jgi:hypothetical protein